MGEEEGVVFVHSDSVKEKEMEMEVDAVVSHLCRPY